MSRIQNWSARKVSSPCLPLPYSPFGHTPRFSPSRMGSRNQSIRHQFHVVDVSATFLASYVTSCDILKLPGELSGIFRKLSELEIESTLELLLLTTKSSKSLESHSFGMKNQMFLSPAGFPRWMPDEAPPSSSRCIDATRIASRVKHVGCVCCVIVAASRAPASRRLLTSLNEACD